MDFHPVADEPHAAELIAARPGLRAHPMDGLLFDGVALPGIAARHGTPCWVTGADTLRRRLRVLRAAMEGIDIHFAVKANDHLAVLAILADAGVGADVVSGGELKRARRAGIPAGRIVFSGVGKTREELAAGLAHSIAQINVESAEELATLSALAVESGRVARVALRINPDVDAGTHAKISTGRAGDKFGIPLSQAATLYAHASSLPGLQVTGLAVHIGSQIFGMTAFTAAYRTIASLVVELRHRGLSVEAVDCGGGLGVPYAGEPATPPGAWAGAIRAAFGGLDLRLAIEPGRWLAGPAGVLLASVIRTRREGMPRPIVILDAAMNDLARPSLYDAWHGVVPLSAASLAAPAEAADIAGPVCESSDFLGRRRMLAPLEDGALVAILDTGAYGAVMSSSYNARPQAAQVLIDSGLPGGHVLVRARGTAEGLWADEIVPARA